MINYTEESFANWVVAHDVVGFFDRPITLKSGRQSNWYVNWRSPLGDVCLTDQLTDYLLSFVEQLILNSQIERPDTLIGVPEGASKLGVISQYKMAIRSGVLAPGSHALAMGRSKPKEHGVASDQNFLGTPKGKTILLEDTTTTGGSLIQFLDQLLLSGIDVVACIGLTNRMELRDDGKSVREAINERRTLAGKPVDYFEMSKATRLLPLVVSKKTPSTSILEAVSQEFCEVGAEPLTF